ncbi:MAG: S9 family peptidase, partial [Flavobacteriales bacterium]
GLHYTSLESSEKDGSQIVKYSFKTGEKIEVIASSKSIFSDPSRTIDDYDFSKDEQQILIATDQESIYRRSSEANYYIHNLEKSRSFPLTEFTLGKQRLAEFSPIGDMVCFMRDNNLFTVDLKYREEAQVTFDGKNNQIINGATDWVYEEEFGFSKGFYWSPKGDRIAYYKFDESAVKEFQMATYGDLYPEQYKFKYPKAGEDNSVVSIFIYDTEELVSKKVDLGENKEQYIPRIQWTKSNDKLCIMRMNRHQNHLEFLMTDLRAEQPFSIGTKTIYEERSSTYIEINDNLIFLQDGKSFLWNSEKDGFNHIYQFGLNGKEIQQLTSGNWDVIEFYGVNEEDGMIYFSSAQENALERHVYVKGINKRTFKKLSDKSGTNDAAFSKGFKYYINYNSAANSPYYITLHNSNGKLQRVLKTNEGLKKTLSKYNLSQKEFFTFENSGGTTLNAWMIKPPNFDASKKYPVYVNIYGGPGHNTVTDEWGGRNYLYHQLLAQEGYIVVSVDPRGSMYRGKEFKHSTYLQLGKLETEDFIDFGKHMASQPFVDADRIGIQGWSYGGYMTSLCMTKGAEVYSMGIAVAPVTNWRYYDSIYTERFMRTPQENSEGYDDNSPINHVEKLEGSYLLIHGSSDDNVHYQNSMEMVDALVRANKQFDLFFYPNKNHGIYGGNTRLHLFTMMLNYTKNNL